MTQTQKELKVEPWVNYRGIAKRENTLYKAMRARQMRLHALEILSDMLMIIGLVIGAGAVYWADNDPYWWHGAVIATAFLTGGLLIAFLTGRIARRGDK